MKTVIRPESEMKDSGIEWVENIPKNWRLRKINSLFETIGSGTTPNSNIEEYYQGMVNWLQSGDINGTIVKSTKKHISNEIISNTSALTVYKAPFIVIAMYGASIGNISMVDIDACTNQACCALVKPIKDIDMQYAFWGLMAAKEELVLSSRGGGQPNISQNIIKQLRIPVPYLQEQQAIADYLDETCSKIDEIIAEAKASIDEYKNLREAVISNATTRGIKKNRCMKSSGVEWVLEIPSDWDMIPAKVLFSQSNERKHVDDVQLTASQKYGIISQVEYMKRENSRIVIATQGIENWKHVEPNDFIISLRSFQGGLEKSDVSGCITWHYVVLKANNGVYYDYFKWLFKSDKYINALQGTCNFIRNGQDLRFSNFVQVPLLVVPIEEQKEIADYLNKKVPKIDSLIAEKESLIADLEAYKKSLIYEVVTGKRRVV